MNDTLKPLLDRLDAIDMVNHPPHYTAGGVECIDAIKSSMTLESFRGYLKGNIFKYLWRYEKKNGLQDLEKAQWYKDKLLETFGADGQDRTD